MSSNPQILIRVKVFVLALRSYQALNKESCKEEVFLDLPNDSLSITQCDTSNQVFSLREAPYFDGYENFNTPSYWKSYGINWMKLEGIEAVPYLEEE